MRVQFNFSDESVCMFFWFWFRLICLFKIVIVIHRDIERHDAEQHMKECMEIKENR